MKRKGNLYYKIYSMDNLILAEKKARRGKSKRKEVIKFNQNLEDNLFNIQQELINKEFTTSEYRHFKVNDGKERDVCSLPYRDRVVQWGIMNVLEPILYRYLTADTYSCVLGRGVHKMSYKLRDAMKGEWKYYLQIDIRKFYPSINNEILKSQLRRKFKDDDLLWLLDNIIDSAMGLPLGNLTSQHLANFYLAGFDKFVKQDLKAKYYFRYCDDMIILGNTKEELWDMFYKIKKYLGDELKLELSNYQVKPTWLGINVVGYKHYDTHVLLRPSIKKRFIRMMFKDRNAHSIASYKGWILHSNGANLMRKYRVL